MYVTGVFVTRSLNTVNSEHKVCIEKDDAGEKKKKKNAFGRPRP